VKDSAFTERPRSGTAVTARGRTGPGTARRAIRDETDGQTARERRPPPALGHRRAARHRARGDRRGGVVHSHPRHRRPARPGRPDVLGRSSLHRLDLRGCLASGSATSSKASSPGGCRGRPWCSRAGTAEPGGQPRSGPADGLGPDRGRRVHGRGLHDRTPLRPPPPSTWPERCARAGAPPGGCVVAGAAARQAPQRRGSVPDGVPGHALAGSRNAPRPPVRVGLPRCRRGRHPAGFPGGGMVTGTGRPFIRVCKL
jgi:hypothetical protein